ncbi:MAG: hypothetical protein Q7R34_11475, partial [Dehalococcoidia bacterium]|nr:hypothetical protein [Dehalococcoidia bacterium]
SFYTDSLTKGEKERLPEARQVEGLDEEIALLRVKLNQLVAKHSDDTDGLVKTVRLLLQAVAIKYRLSPKAKDDLYESLAGVINGVGGIMLPEAFKMDKEE